MGVGSGEQACAHRVSVRLPFGKLRNRADSERSTERSRRSLVELHAEVRNAEREWRFDKAFPDSRLPIPDSLHPRCFGSCVSPNPVFFSTQLNFQWLTG
jgi:hypothetical protein